LALAPSGIFAGAVGSAQSANAGNVNALAISAKVPEFSHVALLQQPLVALPSGMGVQQEPDRRFRDYIDSWSDYNTGTRLIGGWIRAGLLAMGVKPETIPADANL